SGFHRKSRACGCGGHCTGEVSHLTLRAICMLSLGWLVCAWASPLAAAPNTGAISGVVVDVTGTPQMGAAVLISSEKIAASVPLRLLTNDLGHFATPSLPVGMYTIHVTLAGFLPAVEQHVRVNGEQATLLEIVVDSVFSSFEKLRRNRMTQFPPTTGLGCCEARRPHALCCAGRTR